MEPIDVVIPFHPKDRLMLPLCVAGVKKNLQAIRNVYIVCEDDPKISETLWIAETLLPFSKSDITEQLDEQFQWRTGWYLQQLCKIYAGKVISNLSENYLVIDSDSIFLKPVQLLNEFGAPTLNTNTHQGQNPNYFAHMEKLNPKLQKAHPKSGISHFMLMKQQIWLEIIALVESYHHQIFWKVFLKHIQHHSGASEYEIYFHYIISKNYPVQIVEWEFLEPSLPQFVYFEDISKNPKHFMVCYHHYRTTSWWDRN